MIPQQYAIKLYVNKPHTWFEYTMANLVKSELKVIHFSIYILFSEGSESC